jgi:hypothetical protein
MYQDLPLRRSVAKFWKRQIFHGAQIRRSDSRGISALVSSPGRQPQVSICEPFLFLPSSKRIPF